MDQNYGESLYGQWRAVAAANAERPAIFLPGGKTLTFRELAERAETLPKAGRLLTSRRRGLAFVDDVLRAWRDGAALAPVDGALNGPPEAALAGLPPEIVHIKTTSGSTGTPRHVLFTAAQLAADAAQIVAGMGLRPDWPNVAAISMAHSYGFSNLVLPLLLNGVPLILTDDPLPATLRGVLERHEAVTLPAVPALWRAWHRAGVLEIPSIRLAISAGAPLPLELEREVHAERGLKIHNFYGSSECGGIAYDREDSPRPDAALAGTPLDAATLSIDPATGCLRVSGPAAGFGYLEPDAALRDGVFLTSDLAELPGGPRGPVRLLGRTGEAINVAGRKLSPAAIEAKLLQLPGVRYCVVFGAPGADAVRVEEIVACVRLEDGTPLEAVRRAAAGALSPAETPRHWWPDASLRPDDRGKISRAAWRARWLERRERGERADSRAHGGETAYPPSP